MSGKMNLTISSDADFRTACALIAVCLLGLLDPHTCDTLRESIEAEYNGSGADLVIIGSDYLGLKPSLAICQRRQVGHPRHSRNTSFRFY